MGNVDRHIIERCRAQRGLVTLDQLHELGLSADQVRHRRESGILLPANNRVLRHAAVEETWAQRSLAAVMAAGPQALLARRSAARLWDLAGARTDHVEVVTPRWTRRHLASGRLIESSDLRVGDATVLAGIPVTTVTRTLLDLGTKIGPRALERMADDAVRSGLTSYEAILDRFVQLARRGRPGIAAMRRLLAERLGVELAGNDFEQLFLRLVIDGGLPAPVLQHAVIIDGARYLLDFAWPARMVFAECDGFDTHGTPQALTADLERQNRLTLAGWFPLRYSWRTVHDRPERVVEELRRALT